MTKQQRVLALVLGGIGCFDMLAILAVVMPEAWMQAAHRFAGLGTMPGEPIVGYLARSASALYALHGAIVVFLSFDVVRYEPLLRFMGFAAVVHGIVMLGIDVAQQMPAYWQYGEGPAFSATGAIVLWLIQRARRGGTAPS